MRSTAPLTEDGRRAVEALAARRPPADPDGLIDLPDLSRFSRVLGGRSAPYIGGWCHLAGAFHAEIVAAARLDWCCVDRQHGMIDEAAMFDMVRVLEPRGHRHWSVFPTRILTRSVVR